MTMPTAQMATAASREAHRSFGHSFPPLLSPPPDVTGIPMSGIGVRAIDYGTYGDARLMSTLCSCMFLP